MKIFLVPEKVSALIFDMDNTLYTHDEYIRFQIESPIRRLAERRGVSFDEMRDAVSACRKKHAEENRGAQLSLGNIFKSFGVGMEETIRWREELYRPELFLGRDGELREALLRLSACFSLGLYTNNPVQVAGKTLACLGVEDCFPVIVGLDTCLVSKPSGISLRKTAELLGADARNCVSIGDRYDIDLALPLELGMGGILVDGVSDVYRLPSVFEGAGFCL
ncbi:MAG: HAD hydrolase-like protein [Spirochaetaceae bacterium]|jgi:phosphoglycolate phosphatase/putative hydrolase of the HAD superfamily|nr:HAD hydrolase-like protein [Spirochaetaceae bacterium]